MSDSLRVLVGQSFFLRLDPKNWQGGRAFPPLGSLIAAACVRDAGHDVHFFDAMLAESVDEWTSAMDRYRPDVAVLFEDHFNYLTKMCLLQMRDAAFRMIASARERRVPVLVCGSDATDLAETYLGEGATAVLLGEGEATLVDVLDLLSERKERDVGDVPGVAVLDRSGSLRRSEARPVLRDLDALPLPARELVDLDAYREIGLRTRGFFQLNLAATRGCPYHCNWCAKPIWGQTYNMRSAGAVAEEIARLAAGPAPDRLWFSDDILGLKRGWLAELADALEGLGIRIPFECQSRADVLLRRGEVEALSRAGGDLVWIGAESGSQRILDAMDKGTRVEQIREAAVRVREAGMRIGFFLQFGYPGEEREDVEATLRLVRESRPDEIGMSVSYALPGTKFHERVQAQLGQKRNWVDSQDLDMMYRGRFTTGFYRQLYRVLHRDFRLRRTLDELREDPGGFLDPSGLLRVAKAAGQALLLPWDRWRLDRLSRVPNEGVAPLGGALDPESAARPTPQHGEGST